VLQINPEEINRSPNASVTVGSLKEMAAPRQNWPAESLARNWRIEW
jgi:hypothetical protein